MSFRTTPEQRRKQEKISWLMDAENAVPIPSRYNVTREHLATLEEQVTGRIVYPWSPDYDAARREFNDVYPATPLVIVFVANYQDVRWCLELARDLDLITTVRSGRHSIADYSVCDGLIIDISNLKSVVVDTQAQTAVVEAGNTFADLNPQLEFYGMHLPGGGCPTVSVAGFMQGGGYGLTSRNYGIQSDCVLEFTMMLADGNLVVANAVQNADLFWAVRGGTGGNFGVLLSIKYKIFPLGLIWGLKITWDFEEDVTNAAQALYAIQEHYLKGNQFPELGIETLVFTDNATDGHKKVMFGAGFIGTETELETVIQPLRAIPGAVVVKMQDRYSKVNGWVLEGVPQFPPNTKTVKFFGRSAYISKLLSVEDYAAILTFFKKVPNNYGMLDLEGYGGAINQYPVESSAFIHRNVLMDFYTILFFDVADAHDQEKNRQWMISLYQFMEQYTNGHSYQNYPNRDQPDWQWAYWGSYYNQLVNIKKKYDPQNFFRYGQAIGPPNTGERADQQKLLFGDSPIVHENY